MSKNKPGFCQY